MFYTIDRFEGDYAVCEAENQEMVNILRNELPPDCMEGSKIQKTEQGYVVVDNESDRERISRKMHGLFRQ